MSVGKKEMAPSSEGQQGGGGGGGGGGENGAGAVVPVVVVQGGRKEEAAAAAAAKGGTRYARCFSGLEISVGPGSLRDADAGRLKSQIRRWAKAVVAYARQISFGSPRAAARSRSLASSRRAMSIRSRDGDGGGGLTATVRSATFPSKSGLGEANNDEIVPAP
uniref:Uncharacterized protein n=1 Tax=Oryza punctata TaxID=4537 RepID=A0A0E0JK44_ORYPU